MKNIYNSKKKKNYSAVFLSINNKTQCLNLLFFTTEIYDIHIILFSTISFIKFWDFLMFYQIFFSPQVKQWGIITYKLGIWELPYEFPNDVRLTVLGNKEIWEKCLDFIASKSGAQCSCQIKFLLILTKNSWKTDIQLFP